MKPKVALMSFITGQKVWPEEQVKECYDFLKKVRTSLERIGLEVVDPGEITRDHVTAWKQADMLKKTNPDCFIAYTGFWLFSSAVVAAADCLGLPAVIWTNKRQDTAGFIGAAISRGSLDNVGIPNVMLASTFNDSKSLEKIKKYVIASAAVQRLKGKTLARFGGRSLSMYTGMIDEHEWRRKFHIEVEDAEQLELVEQARKISPERVARFKKWMGKTFGPYEAGEDIQDRQIRLHLAMKDKCLKEGYDMVGLKCLTELPQNYVSGCLAHALLNDGNDAEGDFGPIVCACENDNNGLLAMYLLHLISGNPVAFADFRHVDEKTNEMTLCNCGAQPTLFAKSRKDVRFCPQCKANGPGACTTYMCKPGLITLARLSRIKGRHRMLIFTGDVFSAPVSRMKASGMASVWPHAFIKMHCSYEAFLEELRSNHLHFTYGDYVEELAQACRFLNIEPAVISAK